MVNLNEEKEWKEYKELMENEFRKIGEYVRIIRTQKKGAKFTAVSLETGLNMLYKIPNKEITIWGVGKRYSNGYITYEQMVKKAELFKKLMEEVTCE